MNKNQAITRALEFIEKKLREPITDIRITDQNTAVPHDKITNSILVVDRLKGTTITFPYKMTKKLEPPDCGAFVAVWVDDEREAIPKISAGKFDENKHLLCIETNSAKKYSDWPHWKELEYK